MENPVLTLCGTYTLDPVAEAVEYWLDFLGIDAGVRVASYGQVFQQLLDPGSALRRNRTGANVLLIRWSDLLARDRSAADGPSRGAVEQRVVEVADALQSYAHQVPCMVLVGPADQAGQSLDWATTELQTRLAGTPNLHVAHGERAMQRYRVERSDDPASDRFGHVPYTSDAIAALGTTVARWYAAQVRAPLKVIAVDGDHTLWSGVVAEDGIDALRIEDAHAGLQSALVRQADSGRLLCLLSKNEEADVRAVFTRRREMPLQWSHFVASRVDWNPKPDNLGHLASELGLGLDSVAFLDDNPVECAQMRARCPEVATVRVPTDPARLTAFTEHLWLLDQPAATREDASRTRMYRENAARAQARQATDSLQSFMDGLELVVEIEPPAPDELPRLAQLTQRTNQFNASLVRCSESEVRNGGGGTGAFHRLVRARDRFGDYGIVGQVRARAQGDCLQVDLFMLSCRALGRGIEHRMLAATGAHAAALGLAEVAVMLVRGERNAPARRFLERVVEGAVETGGSEDGAGQTDVAAQPELSPQTCWLRIATPLAAALKFDAAATADDDQRRDEAKPNQTLPNPEGASRDMGTLYEQIAHNLTTAADIRQAMASRVRPRPELSAGFVSPAAGHERVIASIWQQVLRIESIGVHDRFQDLGGKSIHLVQVHSQLLERLDVALDITALFQHATVASLAAHLSTRAGGGVTGAAHERALKMRQARTRAASRHSRPPVAGASA